jgi:hypothetical protein
MLRKFKSEFSPESCLTTTLRPVSENATSCSCVEILLRLCPNVLS